MELAEKTIQYCRVGAVIIPNTKISSKDDDSKLCSSKEPDTKFSHNVGDHRMNEFPKWDGSARNNPLTHGTDSGVGVFSNSFEFVICLLFF